MKRTRAMACSHAEFMRLLPRALDGYDYTVNRDVIKVDEKHYRIRIDLGPEYEHRIAMLATPVTDVTICLEGFSENQASAFLEKFDRTYRRGGG